MSYTILYRSMFAKVGEDQYIPMIEVGDNNVYVCYGGKEKRERTWRNWRVPGFEGKFILTRQEIMIGLNNLIDKYNKKYVNEPIHGDARNGYWTYKSIEKNFGWLSGIAVYGKHTTMTTARMVANFFKRGLEQCIDFTQMDKCNFGTFPIRVYDHSNDAYCKAFQTSDGLDVMVKFLKEADRDNFWIEYSHGSVEIAWDEVRNRRGK